MITIELSHRLADRYGANLHEAKWSIDIRGQLTVGSMSGRIIKASITTAGQTKGLYHKSNSRAGEIYTESFTFSLTQAAPAKAK